MGIFFPILSGVENGRFIRWECLLFQFFCRRIGIHIPVLAGAQNGRMLILKKSYFTKKLFFLKLNFQVDSHLYAICLFFILILYRKCFFFFFSVFVLWHTCAQMEAFLAEKMWYFSEKCCFWSLISKMKISCMLIACFIFCLFTVNAFFFSY